MFLRWLIGTYSMGQDSTFLPAMCPCALFLLRGGFSGAIAVKGALVRTFPVAGFNCLFSQQVVVTALVHTD